LSKKFVGEFRCAFYYHYKNLRRFHKKFMDILWEGLREKREERG
jgi:hypothetical protein